MLSIFKHSINLSSQLVRKCKFQSSSMMEKLQNGLTCVFNKNQNFHTDTSHYKHSNILEFRKAQKDAAKKVIVKEDFMQDIAKKRRDGYFPTVDLPDQLFNNVPFKNLPIISIKVSRNNTIMSLSSNGATKMSRSCGVDGFKNSRKGTNVAAQATGTSFAIRARKKGFKTVRVVLKGLGPGRLSSIKGLQLGGMDVVSITDKTISAVSTRPRKQKRL